MFEKVKQDYLRCIKDVNNNNNADIVKIIFLAMKNDGFRAVFFYRIARWFRQHGFSIAAGIIERFMHHLCHCWISSCADIDSGFVIAHVCGIIIPPGVIIGKNCDIRQNVTLGGNYGKKSEDGRTNPKLGDYVSIGANAVILGPITIGSHSIIGANSTVTKSVPEHSVVAGFRAEVVSQCVDNTDYHRAQISRNETNVFLSRRQLFERINSLELRIKELEEYLKK